MTDTTEVTAATPASAGDADLSTLRLPQLQAVAAQLGIGGTGRMRKSELLDAIRNHQNGHLPDTAPAAGNGVATTVKTARAPRAARRAAAPAGPPTPLELPIGATGDTSGDSAGQLAGQVTTPDEGLAQIGTAATGTAPAGIQADFPAEPPVDTPAEGEQAREGRQNRDGRDGQNRNRDGRGRNQNRDGTAPSRVDQRSGMQNDRPNDRQNDRAGANEDDEDDEGRGGRRRRGRYRDRKRRGRDGQPVGGAMADEPEVSEDDVLLPVAGILDVLDSFAFLRTSGYLPGNNDVYVSLGQVKKYGLRKGDAVTGAVRQPREGEQQNQRQKFNALVRLDTVNGSTPDEARQRAEFGKLTPLYPQERLRLETEPGIITTRIIDLVAPIGKGQRALIVSPSKAGKTLVMQAIANAITHNNPECHLMVVLVDERPEEVTDMQRAVKGEVIASTFDRPADDHTTVAELAIERAKRLVELGHDVVVLLDSITRLGRAYNLAAPASGRILSGGVDSSALYPPKRFFGAARNIEHGGSLTIIATALIETGSKMDEVIFEEFKGTGNMELRLRRELADKRIFPAVDVNASGTRREEILMGKEELAVIYRLRRVMGALEPQQAIELLMDRVKKSGSNAEFLMQVQKTAPGHEE